MIVFILLLVCLSLCAYLALMCRLWKSASSNIVPLHSGILPLIGHAHLLLGDTTYLWSKMKAISRECVEKGGVIRFFIGSQLYYFITDPEDIYTTANACLRKHYVYDFGKVWFGDGLITASGPVWQRHRKLLNPAFNPQVLNGFLGIFNSQARKLVHELSPKIEEGPFDISTYLTSITLESICLTAFGVNSEDDENFNKKYMQAIDKVFAIVAQRFQKFWLHSDFMYKLSGWKQKETELIQTLNDMSNGIIRKKRAVIKDKYREVEEKPTTTGLKFKPFLDLLIELSEDETFTDKEIKEELDTAIVAGFQTSSWVLTYALIFLGSYPEVQDRVVEELQAVFGDADRDVTKEDLTQLLYTEAVLKETMRLHPVLPAVLRYVDKDVKLRNYTMRAGSNCVFLMYGLHRDPVWGPDADEFKPERWFQSTLPNPNAFGAFSIGKRSCIGKTYALMSLKTAFVHLIREYRVKADVTKLVCKIDIVLKPVAGSEVSLEKRKTPDAMSANASFYRTTT